MRNMFRVLVTRLTVLASDESGMSTVEYAIGTIAAAAFRVTSSHILALFTQSKARIRS